MTKMDAYRYLRQQTPDIAFVANVILTRQANAAKRLKGAATLVQAGHHLACGQFAIDVLMIDGAQASWQQLETV